MLSRAAEDDITESLFGDLNTTAKSLVAEKDYQNFGKKVAGVLYQGQAPYRIPAFFKEVFRDIQKELDSKKIKEVLDSITTLYNEKVKEEKEKDKGGKAKAKK
jgi:5'-deoxynucleotidase YfbR-like HD superfamily hydrolase